MASSSASQRIEEAKSFASNDPAKAEKIYRDVLSGGVGKTESASRDYEAALVGLGELYRDHKRADELAELIKTSRDAFSSFAKAKTAKLGEFSSLIDRLCSYSLTLSSATTLGFAERDPEDDRYTGSCHQILD